MSSSKQISVDAETLEKINFDLLHLTSLLDVLREFNFKNKADGTANDAFEIVYDYVNRVSSVTNAWFFDQNPTNDGR